MPLTGPAKPHSKDAQLARGDRRYRRKIASPKQWQAIIAAKGRRSRIAGGGPVEYHHLVPRDAPWFGDDVPANIIPLAQAIHGRVENRDEETVRRFLAALTDSEYAYAIEKCGEDFFERCYGLRYLRV